MRLFQLSLFGLAALTIGACGPEATTTAPTEATTPGEVAPPVEPTTSSSVDLSTVTQVDAPPEFATAYEAYLRGHYTQVENDLLPLTDALEQPGDTEFRAASQVKALTALAIAEVLPENAVSLADIALDHARAIKDPSAQQLARIARASYLLGMSEVTPAQAELVRAVGLDGPHLSLANVFLAKVLINQAFGPDERMVRPGKLDEAETTYRAVLDAGAGLLTGHVYEGLAAISKYRGDRDATCENATAALQAYENSGMSDYLLEGPVLLQSEANCDG